MSAAPYLAPIGSPERELMLGMVFLWTLTDGREVTMHRDAVLWLADYGAATIARDGDVTALPLGALQEYARERIGAFVDAAREARPDVLAACETAAGGDA